MNRETGISGARNGVTANYAQFAAYAAQGSLAQVSYGNTLVDKYTYNNRLQVLTFSASINGSPSNTYFWQAYNWGTTNNNGNLQVLDEYNQGTPFQPTLPHFTRNYFYDGANRFYYGYEDGTTCPASANYACWYRTFGYDAVGNRWLAANGGLPVQTATPASNIYNANNRMTTASYDAAGNQLGIGVTGLTYDAENRQASAVDPPQYGGTTSYYRYDGFGRRVEKAVNIDRATSHQYDTDGNAASGCAGRDNY